MQLKCKATQGFSKVDAAVLLPAVRTFRCLAADKTAMELSLHTSRPNRWETIDL